LNTKFGTYEFPFGQLGAGDQAVLNLDDFGRSGADSLGQEVVSDPIFRSATSECSRPQELSRAIDSFDFPTRLLDHNEKILTLPAAHFSFG
jgi:hypothetical protein